MNPADHDAPASTMPTHGDLTQRYGASLMGVFGAPGLVLERGEGAVVRDVEGREYLDLLAGIAVNVLGHAHPALVAAVSEQAATSWSVSEPSVLPVVPILAAHPEPGPMPWFTPLLALLPVLVGAFVAHRTLRSMSRLASSGTKAVAIGVAILLAAVLVGLLDALAGGSFGAARLSSVGAPAGLLTLALAGEMLLGAVVVLVRDVRRLR